MAKPRITSTVLDNACITSSVQAFGSITSELFPEAIVQISETRITESGDRRITETSDVRVTEGI